MELSRRGFLKGAVGAAGVGMAYGLSSAAPALAVEASEEWKLVNTEEYTNICCYCSGAVEVDPDQCGRLKRTSAATAPAAAVLCAPSATES